MAEEIINAMKEGRSVVVSYNEAGEPVIEPYRGISKARLGKGELKGVRKRKPKAPANVVKTAGRIAEKLIENRIPFRVIVGRGEVEVRFTLDQYIKLTKDGEAKLVGFRSEEDHPINLIKEELTGLKISLLKPL